MHHARVELQYVAVRALGARRLEAAGDRTFSVHLHEVVRQCPYLLGREQTFPYEVTIFPETPDLLLRQAFGSLHVPILLVDLTDLLREGFSFPVLRRFFLHLPTCSQA